jgi:hypothetical protein
MTDTLSGAPPFLIAGVKFSCWLTGNSKKPGTSKYEWRDATNRLRVGRFLGRGECWATVDGVKVAGYHPTLGAAMRAAVVLGARRAA